MKLDRFRAPALAAAAVLMISGAGIAFAAGPVETKSTGPDTDNVNVQEGDQTTSDNHGLVVSQAAKADFTTGKAHGAAVSKVAQTAEGKETKGTESEGAADAAAQHAACLAATPAINDTVTPNVQYDDATGACSLDTGGTDNNGE